MGRRSWNVEWGRPSPHRHRNFKLIAWPDPIGNTSVTNHRSGRQTYKVCMEDSGMKGILGFCFLLMPVILVGGWLGLTWFLWKCGWRFLKSAFFNRAVRVVLIVIIAALWFGGAFWEVGGKKLYWDAKVRELCAKDGGVKVYETVELPQEMFDKYGNLNLPPKDNIGPKDQYCYEWNTHSFRKGNPEIWRDHIRIIRLKDKKIMGEAIGYSRRGGDLPGPWHESSYRCPQAWNLESSIFKNEEKKP